MLKHRGLLFCLAAVSVIVLSSCEDKNVIEDIPDQLTVPEEFAQIFNSGIDFGASAEGVEVGISGPVSKTLTFNATSDWSTVITDTKASAWLTVEPASGGPGKVDMTVTAQPNTSEEPRSASVTIACGEASMTFDVRQEGAPAVPEYAFEISPTSVSLKSDGGSFEVNVTCTGEYHMESMPEWVEQLSVADKVHTFSAAANTSESERRGVIVFCDNEGTCLPCSISQEGAEPAPDPEPEQPDFDWSQEFYHRSLFMRFTATWCGYCPYMAKAVHIAQTNNPDKLECINLHASDSDLAFAGTSSLFRQYGIAGYPTGIVDGRRRLDNNTNPTERAQVIGQMIAETEATYPTASAIGIKSFFFGQTLMIGVDLYLKTAGQWKVTVVLSENNIVGYQADYGEGPHSNYVHNDVARAAVTNISGDSFFTFEENCIKSLNYSVYIPDNYKKDNLKVLVYVQREYGLQPVLRDGKYGEYYVDNCAAVKAGKSVAPAVVSGRG